MIRSTFSRRLIGLITSTVLVLGIAAPAAAVDGGTMVSLANAKRSSVGLSPVSLQTAVDKVSDERAVQMASSDNFSHDMTYIANRLKQLGVCFTGHGEIIAWDSYATYDPSRTMEQWWKSDGHRKIITGNYNAAGGSHRKSTKSGKNYSVMIFVKLCSAPPPPSGGDTEIKRLAGNDRYATAAAISKMRFAGGASTVFIATGGSFPDALAGSPAAAKLNGPILLTDPGKLPAATAAEVDRLNPSKIIILGGAASVSGNVASALAAYAPVARWAGSDRYSTAAAVSQKTFAPGVPVVYVATGLAFPDALSGGAIAGKNGGPILLVKQNALPASTAAELDRLNPGKIVILGGTGAVNGAVATAMGRYGAVSRLSGSDRYATAVAVSKAGYANAASAVAAFVATGSNFPDGLAGGPVAALVPGPLLLVAPGTLPGVVATELRRLAPDTVWVLGGPGSVSGSVVTSIDAALP